MLSSEGITGSSDAPVLPPVDVVSGTAGITGVSVAGAGVSTAGVTGVTVASVAGAGVTGAGASVGVPVVTAGITGSSAAVVSWTKTLTSVVVVASASLGAMTSSFTSGAAGFTSSALATEANPIIPVRITEELNKILCFFINILHFINLFILKLK